MKEEFARRIRPMPLVIFAVVVVSVIIAGAMPQKAPNTRPAQGFTIVTKETIRFNDPKMQAKPLQADYVITVRNQKSDGMFKEVRTRYKSDGKVLSESTTFGVPGTGVFQDIGSGELEFLSAMPPRETTASIPIVDAHNHPRFVRHEMVQGYNTYVLRYEVGQKGCYEEEYYAPELDNYPIRGVKVAPYGGSVTELVQVTLGDPPEDVFITRVDGKVRYDLYKSMIKSLF